MDPTASCPRSPRPVALLLAVGALSLVFGGCGGTKLTRSEAIERYGQELREVVSARVIEEDRRNRLLRIVDQLEALHLHFSRETESFIRDYRALNAEYDAERPAFEQLFSDYNSRRIEARARALNLHFELASLATAEEWGAIVKAEARLYEKATLSIPATRDTG